MAERRLTFSVKDDEEVVHQGEVVIVRAWRPDIELTPHVAFTIVLAQEPLTADNPPRTPNVVVCGPASALRLPASVAEATVAYETGAEPAAAPIRLSPRAMASYAEGALLAAQPLSTSTHEVFAEGAQPPRLHLLARDLLAAARHVEACWQAIDRTLSLPNPSRGAAFPEQLRPRLGDILARVSSGEHRALAAEPIARMEQIVAGASPEAVGASPAQLAEDVAFIRCLSERPAETAGLATMRAYLAGAKPCRRLLVDHATTQEQLSFVALLSEPRQLGRMRATFEFYRGEYVATYTQRHQAYWRAFAPMRSALDEASPTVQALTRLNTLSSLGGPLGRAALAAYRRLTRGQRTCPAPELASTLLQQPVCPDCKITLEDSPPIEHVDEVLRRLHAALARQHARLAGEAVHRILARGGGRIEQFLQIVQASDLAGLAQVLDEELLAFLRELLSEPVSPSSEALDLFLELARAHPTVTEEQVEAVIQTLRRLLTEKLASQQAADPSQRAALRLASAPPPSPP